MPVILEHWKFVATENSATSVLPGGCRDLIIKQSKGHAPICFISDLANSCDQVEMRAGDCFCGFRLQPGARINAGGLLGQLPTGRQIPRSKSVCTISSRKPRMYPRPWPVCQVA